MNYTQEEILNLYKSRLLNITSRNKALSFRLSKAGKDSIDMYFLKDFNFDKFLNGPEKSIKITQKQYIDYKINTLDFDSLSTSDKELKKQSAKEEFNIIKNKCEKIIKQQDDIYKETGNNVLYLASSFISGIIPTNNKSTKMYAPLFLIPIEIIVNNHGIEINKKEEDVVLNRTPFVALMKYCKAKFPDVTEFYYTQYNPSLLSWILEQFDKETLIPLIYNKEITKFPTTVSDFKIDNTTFNINSHIIFSCIPLISEIYSDYEKMNGEANETMKTLLSEELVDGPSTEEIKTEYETENKKVFSITPLDKSQEFSVYMAQKSKNLVIYGPPGTGKSETILNIIADNLYQKKKILVVSEKKAAINVIYNRLSKLQNLAIMIDNNSYNYNKFKTELMSKLKSSEEIYSQEKRMLSLENMNDCLAYFNEIHSILTQKHFGKTLSEWFYDEQTILTETEENLMFDILNNTYINNLFNMDNNEFETFINNVANIKNINLYKKITSSDEDYMLMKYMFDNNISPLHIKNELRQSKEIILPLKEEIEKIKEEKELLLETFEKLINEDTKLTVIKKEKSQIESQIKGLEDEQLNLESKYNIKEKSVESIDNEILLLETEITQIENSIAVFPEKANQIKLLNDKLESMNRNLSLIRKDIFQNQKIIKAKEKNIKDLEKIFTEKEAEKEALQNSLFKFFNSKNIASLQENILTMSNEITEKQVEIATLTDNVFELEKQQNIFLEEHKSLSREIENLKEDLESLYVENTKENLPDYSIELAVDSFKIKTKALILLINEKIDYLRDSQKAINTIEQEITPTITKTKEQLSIIESQKLILSKEIEKIQRQISIMDIPEIFETANYSELKKSINQKYINKIIQKENEISQEYKKMELTNKIRETFNIENIFDAKLLNIISQYEEQRDDFRRLYQLDEDIFKMMEYLDTKNFLDSDILNSLTKIYKHLRLSEIDEQFGDSLCKIEHYDNIQNIYRENEREYLSLAASELININNPKTKTYDKYSKEEERERKEFISELEKKRSRFKMRQFMERFTNIMLTNFPIFLLTPEALSKYVPLNKDIFDVIIFDEASQLLIEKTIPGIYRAKNMIVVGDNKQLQPAQFFKVQNDVKDEIDIFFEDKSGINDFSSDAIEEKSLLNVAQTRYNSVRLLFHYRSKFLELINFSNNVFYHGELKLAPNTHRKNENKAIKRYLVRDGIFENGTNIREAEETVKILHNILSEKRQSDTVGIITFNAKQKDLIEDLIIERAQKNKHFESLYQAEKHRIENYEDKSFFIKNIENVQGDERDIIIFAIGYGYNTKGTLSTNFGPLSLAGGENRLNVAITRAKKEVHIITSFEPELLEVEETKNDGAKILKSYLEYTKHISNNNQKLAQNILEKYHINKEKIKTDTQFKNNLEQQIYKELTSRGLLVDTQIGDCGFDIDLAILNPETNQYILGIECDGYDYHSSNNIKERDILRKSFLKSHKWNIYNVWSILWYKDKEKIINEILKIVEHGGNIIEQPADYFLFKTLTKGYKKDEETNIDLTMKTKNIENITTNEESISDINQELNNEICDDYENIESNDVKDSFIPFTNIQRKATLTHTRQADRIETIENLKIGDILEYDIQFKNGEPSIIVSKNLEPIGLLPKSVANTLIPMILNKQGVITNIKVNRVIPLSWMKNKSNSPYVEVSITGTRNV